MARNSQVQLQVAGLRRLANRVRAVAKTAARAQQRAVASVRRQLVAEAARAVSELQLVAPPRRLSRYIWAKANVSGAESSISLIASRDRLPLDIFKPRVSKRSGVRVAIYRGEPERHWPHAFRHDKKIKQRIPAPGWSESGFVHRLPITTRVGPSMARMLGPVRTKNRSTAAAFGNRDQLVARLTEFARNKLASEVQRLLGVS